MFFADPIQRPSASISGFSVLRPRSRKREIFLPKVRHERRRYSDAPIFREVVFEDCRQHPRHGQTRAVEGVHELGFSTFAAAEPDLGAAGLEGFEIRTA